MAIFGASLLPSGVVQSLMPGDQQQPPQMPTYKPPSTGRRIVGGIGDALQQWAGGRATFAPEMARRQQYAQALQAAQLQRAQAFADWQAKQAYTAEHQQPTSFERDLQAAGIDPASPQGRKLYQQRVTNLADPMQAVPGYDGHGNQVLRFIRPSTQGGGWPQSLGATLPPGWTVGGAPSQGGATFP